MQGTYTHIPETNYVSREHGVAAILLFLFMVLISLLAVLNLLYFYISTFRSMCAVPNMALLLLLLLLLALHICPRTLWWCVTPYVNTKVLEEPPVCTVCFRKRRRHVSWRHPFLFSRPQRYISGDSKLNIGIRTASLVCWPQLTVCDAPRTAAPSLTDQHPQHVFSTGTLPLNRRKCRHKIPAKL